MREKLGWSRKDLADRLGLKTSSIDAWEQGSALPGVWHVSKLEAWENESIAVRADSALGDLLTQIACIPHIVLSTQTAFTVEIQPLRSAWDEAIYAIHDPSLSEIMGDATDRLRHERVAVEDCLVPKGHKTRAVERLVYGLSLDKQRADPKNPLTDALHTAENTIRELRKCLRAAMMRTVNKEPSCAY